MLSSFFACTLYSSSRGNCTYIRTPDAQFLIDAGKNAKALRAGLTEAGTDLSRIQAIFITHEHRDHVSALPVLLKNNPVPVFITKDSVRGMQKSVTQDMLSCFVPQAPLYATHIGNTEIRSFVTSHDSKMSVGYRITYTYPDGKEFRIGYATDIGIVDASVEKGLTGCQAVILEANHDTEMLMTGPYPYQLKERIASRFGHLSNAESAELAAQLAATGTGSFLLAHLSEENNLPDLACQEIRSALGNESIPVRAASPDFVTELSLEGLEPC